MASPPYTSSQFSSPPFPPRSTPFPFQLQKRAGLQETTAKPDKTRYSMTRRNPHIESGQGWKGNPAEVKES